MHRNNLLQKLQDYQPTADEAHYKHDMLAFIQQHPDCFERTLLIGHITASAWLINKAGTHVLLMHHTKLNMWLQLGGHCDGDADVVRVAVKEAQEESGIMGIAVVSEDIFDIDIHRIPARGHEPEHAHYDVRFLLQVTSDETVIQNSESLALRWIGKDPAELPVQRPGLLRMFNKWLQR